MEGERLTLDLDLSAQQSQKSPPSTACTLYVAAAVASISGLLLGYEMGLISGVLLQLRDLLGLSCQSQELVVSSLLLGALLLSLGGGVILDRHGRRFSIILTAWLVVGGTAVLLWGWLPALLVGRAMVGMGVALSGTAACLYVAEIAPRESRGRLVALYELMVVLGVLLGLGGCAVLLGEPQGWRLLFGAVVPPALLQAVAMLPLPPSPRFLVARGDLEGARTVLAQLRGGGAAEVEAELRDVEAGLREERRHGFLELLSTEANMRRRMLTGVALVVLQQATGQPNILFYSAPILRSVGFHSDQAATLASTGLGVVKVVATVPAVLLVDRFGPKSFLCVGAVAMALSLAALGGVTRQSHTHITSLCQSPVRVNHTHWGRGHNTTGLSDPTPLNLTMSVMSWSTEAGQAGSTGGENSGKDWGAGNTGGEDSGKDWGAGRIGGEMSNSLKWISLASLLVYVAAFSISLGPMVYVVLSEIFPTGIRGKAVSVISAINWASNIAVSMTFLTVTERIGLSNVMFCYAGISCVLLAFVILFIPETKGRSLEQINAELAKRIHLGGKV